MSYAPRPILQVDASLVIMWGAEEVVMSECVALCVELERGKQAAYMYESRQSLDSGLTHVCV